MKKELRTLSEFNLLNREEWLPFLEFIKKNGELPFMLSMESKKITLKRIEEVFICNRKLGIEMLSFGDPKTRTQFASYVLKYTILICRDILIKFKILHELPRFVLDDILITILLRGCHTPNKDGKPSLGLSKDLAFALEYEVRLEHSGIDFMATVCFLYYKYFKRHILKEVGREYKDFCRKEDYCDDNEL